MKYYAIPSNNSSITEKHLVEDDILFTNPLAGKGLSDRSDIAANVVDICLCVDSMLS